jgi:site-specific DNA-adenine methylase
MFQWSYGKRDPYFILPKACHDYIDPNIGQGDIVQSIVRAVRHNNMICTGSIIASDACEDLILFYKTLQHTPSAVWEVYKNIQDVFYACPIGPVIKNPNQDTAMTSRGAFFYWIRGLFNGLPYDREEYDANHAAFFLFLTRYGHTHFTKGPNGCNTSYGNKSIPPLTESDIRDVHDWIQSVIFKTRGELND